MVKEETGKILKTYTEYIKYLDHDCSSGYSYMPVCLFQSASVWITETMTLTEKRFDCFPEL